jgi:hypothetical protein
VRIEIGVDEAVRLARAVQPLPPMVLAVRPTADGGAVEVDLDPTRVPGLSAAKRIGAALAGRVTVTARWLGYADGDASLALTAQARGITVGRLLNALADTIGAALAANGLPRDLVELRPTDDGLRLVAHVQAAVGAKASGGVVRSADLAGGRITAEVEVGDVRLH